MLRSNVLEIGSMEGLRSRIKDAERRLLSHLNSASFEYTEALIDSLLYALTDDLFDICKQHLALIKLKGNNTSSRNQDLQMSFPTSDSNEAIIGALLETTISNWVENCHKIFTHWQEDKQLLSIALKTTSLGEPVKLSVSAGEPHNNGAKVCFLHLSTGQTIVYKPKPLEVDLLFFQFAQDVGFKDFYVPWFVCRGEYGWMEFVSSEECTSIDDVERFYFQYGQYLSLMYILEASDLHYENWVAKGGCPVPVDLETLFHHQDDSCFLGRDDASTARGLHTILKTGMLPTESIQDGKSGYSLLNPHQNLSSQAIPTFNGRKMAVKGFENYVINGFRLGYELLIQHQNLLLCDLGNSPLERFSKVNVRFVPRHTGIYLKLLKAIKHPTINDKNIEDKVLKHLRHDLKNRAQLACLIRHEREAIIKGDVPYFWTKFNSKELFSINGLVKSNYFSFSGVELIKMKIRSIGQADMAGQIKILESTLGVEQEQTRHIPKTASESDLCEEFISVIAEKIWNCSPNHQGVKLFKLHEYDPAIGNVFQPNSISLFNGYAGTIAFLSHAEKIGANIDVSELQSVIRELLTDTLNFHHFYTYSKGFHGLSALLYVLYLLKDIWPNIEWLDTFIREFSELYDTNDIQALDADFISGAAGALSCSVSCFQKSGSDNFLNQISELSNHLMSKFSGVPSTWRTTQNRLLMGLAHGLSGVGLALIKAGTMTKNNHYIEKGLALLHEEHSRFDPSIKNWPDLRGDGPNGHGGMSAWCHGGIGIGICRHEVLKILGNRAEDFLLQDLSNAEMSFNFNQLRKNDTLCHGNFGDVELVIRSKLSGRDFIDAELYERKLVSRIENILMNNAHKQFMVPTNMSLMTGWAGIGWQLMRKTNPERYPSLLTLSI